MHAGLGRPMGVPPKPPPLPPTGRVAKPAAAAPRPGGRQGPPQVPGTHNASSEPAQEAAAPPQASAGPAADTLRRKQDAKSKVLLYCQSSASQRSHTSSSEMPLRLLILQAFFDCLLLATFLT